MCEIYAVNTVLVGYLDATFLFIPMFKGIRSSLVCSLESNEKCKKMAIRVWFYKSQTALVLIVCDLTQTLRKRKKANSNKKKLDDLLQNLFSFANMLRFLFLICLYY